MVGPPIREPLPRPELLAPAGDWECARAAVENGADAIYFGLERFNARMRAHNFTEANLPRLMEFLHARGVKGYVAFNTLVFANELADAEDYLRAIIAAGVDAAIVQDVGICLLIRELSPDFPIHGSTQMTVTSAAGVEFAKELGCNLVVLARECSIAEIEKIRASASSDVSSGLPLEVFVHGALCVAYSGQCLTSEALGGRSANRGECAQACRMPYELISDGKRVDLGDRRYLLSPQDLSGLSVLPELVRAGVASLKIEGRLKTPEYVANITRIYRKALDRIGANGNVSEFAGASRYALEMAFSRGLHTGWLEGINNQQLIHARFGKKRGVYLGEVAEVRQDTILMRLEGPLKPGDGVVFDAGNPEEPEEGGRVYSIERRGDHGVLAFGRGDLDLRSIQPGDKVWKTSDPELEKKLRRTFAPQSPQFTRPVDIQIHGSQNTPMTVIMRDELGHIVQVQSKMVLVTAEKRPLTSAVLTDQIGRLGGSNFHLAKLENHLEGGVILPLSELNRLRREAVDELTRLRKLPKRWTLRSTAPRQVARQQATASTSHLLPLVRDLNQLQAALACDVETIYCEFEDPKKYREAVALFRQSKLAAAKPSAAIFVAPPRIFKSGEDWVLKLVRSSEADGYLVRNYDHLEFFEGCRCIGDFSLNIANELTAGYFRNRYHLERLTASYDLNSAQLDALLQAAPPAWFEVTIHQHMPMFHMEHCVFCAFLSEGTDYRNCGRPCDHHRVRLRDRVGAEHILKADAGCRNTVFNARAQTGAEHVKHLQQRGVRHFRIEFVDESPEQVADTLGKYARLLAGAISGSELWRDLKLHNQLGVTRGQMMNLER